MLNLDLFGAKVKRDISFHIEIAGISLIGH